MARRENEKRQSRGAAAVTPQEPVWRERMASWRSSGLTQAAFCRREGLSEGGFGWWKRELAQRDRQRAGSATSAIEVAEAAMQPVRWVQVPARVRRRDEARCGEDRQGGKFEVVLRGGRRVRLGADFDGEGLRRLITVLESLPC